MSLDISLLFCRASWFLPNKCFMRKFFKSLLLSSVLATASIFQASAQVAVPFTMTESIFNSDDVDKGAKYVHVWENGQIRMYSSGLLSDGCGFCWDDHYFTVHISGAPDKVSFSTSASGASTGSGWTLEESADGSSWTKVWSAGGKSNTVNNELSKDTKYVRLHESFNYSGYVKNFTITACHYVKFVANGEVIFTSEPLRNGEAISFAAPTAPTDACHSFVGWDKALPATMGNEDVVITAQYFVPKYTANIQLSDAANGLSLTDGEQTFVCGESVAVEVPTVEGFTFKGWNPALPAVGAAEMEGETYVAQWSRNIHTLSYVADADTQKFEVAYDEVLPTVADPVKNGYDFLNWEPALPAAMPDADVILTAQFKKTVYALNLLVDGDTVSTDSVKIGTAIDRESMRPADKTGFVYEWQSEDVTTMPEADLTFLGAFVRQNYALKIYDVDSIYVDSVVAFEATIDVPQPEKRGYALENWSDLPATMPAEAVNVELSWEKLSYPLVLMMGEDTFLVANYAYGDTIVYPAMPDSANYEWVWDTELPVVMSDADMVINGSWKIQQVFFTAISEGDTIVSVAYRPGDMIDPVVPADREGYTFDGWDPAVPVVMSESDFTTYAQWVKNSYPFYFLVEGDTVFVKEYAYQDSVVAPTMADSVGYTLKLDQDVPVVMPADTVTINAVWTVNKYPFTLMNGSDAVLDTMIAYGSVLVVEDLIQEGYTFDGWDPAIPATMPDSAFAATAQWSVNKYPFYLMVDADTLYQTEIAYNEVIVLPSFEGEKGYSLVLNESLPAAMPADTVTITASWVQGIFPFVLKSGAETLLDTMIAFGETLEVDDLVEEGYTFNGWSPAIPTTMPDSAFTATAQWTINKYPFVLKTDADTLFSAEFEYQSAISYTYDKREGYTLVVDGVVPELMPAGSVTIEASWEVNQHRFALMDGEIAVMDTVMNYGSEISVKDLAREGYTFGGWNPALPATMPDADFVASAVWSETPYVLTFVVDNDTLSQNNLVMGDEVVAPVIADREGYSFSWLDELPATMPSKDVLVRGAYTANSYQFVAVVDGDTVKRVAYKFGEAVEAIAEPVKAGYEFKGWSEAWPETMPAKDLALTAVWKNAQFSYKVMDGEIALIDTVYEFGATIAALTNPTKEGHKFVKWDTVCAVMPAYDVVVNAEWSVLNYSITLMMVSSVNNAMLGAPKRLTFAYGQDVVIEDPTFEGYEFDGWKNDCPATMPAKGFALIALMKPIPQQVGCQDVENEAISFYVSDKTIYLVNYNGENPIKVHDLLGNVVYEGTDREIPVGRQGVYVLSTESRSYKLLVK